MLALGNQRLVGEPVEDYLPHIEVRPRLNRMTKTICIHDACYCRI
jgi:hypothetical protein